MSGWLNLDLSLRGPWLFAALAPLAGLVVYVLYRRTLPPVDRGLRWMLVAARTLALALLLLMLAELVLTLWRKRVERPLVVLLVDTSPSMDIQEDGRSRLARVREVLGQEAFRRVLAPAHLEVRGFAAVPYALSLDTLAQVRPRGQATDLAAALKKSVDQLAERKDLQAILLFSDGIHNLGEDPVGAAGELEVPVYALGVGGEENPADIQIVRAQVREGGYAGHPMQLEAEVRGWGYADREVEMALYEGERLVERRSLHLERDARVQRVVFEIRAADPGPHIYRVVVPPQAGEFSRDNNEALVFARVLEKRIQVLLLAGAPSPDLAFVRRSLEADSNLVVDSWVQKREGVFYRRSWKEQILREKEVVLLLNPGPALLGGRIGRALAQWVEGGGGLLFAGGAQSARPWDATTPVAGVLPVVLRPGARFVLREVAVQLSAKGRQHPIVRLRAGEEERDPWRALPPLPGYLPVVRNKEGAVVLLEAQDPQRPPLVVVGPSGRGKVVVALSAAFWRLDLLSSGVGGRPQTIRRFWQNAVKWLALEKSAGRVRVSTERHVYRGGEEVVFDAQVFDEFLRPQSAAAVQIALEGQGVEFRLQDRGGGHYRGGWTGLGPGEYHYVARALSGPSLIGRDEGRFIVEQHTIESVDLRANKALLGDMARVSKGYYRPLEEWRALLERLNLPPRLVEERHLLPLWGRAGSLLVVVGLLALEWALRKRSGML